MPAMKYLAVAGLMAACAEGPIDGEATDIYLDRAARENTNPVDFSDVRFAPYWLRDGQWTAGHSVAGTAEGHYEIDEAPEGYVIVHEFAAGVDNWSLGDRHVEDAFYYLGRPDAVPNGGASVTDILPLDLEVTGYVGTDEDDLVVDAWGTGDEMYATGPTTTVSRQITTSFNATRGPHLIETSRGDQVAVYHVAKIASSPDVFQLAQRADLSMPDEIKGVIPTVTGAFVDVPTGDTFSLGIDLDAFAAVYPTPAGGTARWSAYLVAGPGVQHGLLQGPDLLALSGTDGTGIAHIEMPEPQLAEPGWSTRICYFYQTRTPLDPQTSSIKTTLELGCRGNDSGTIVRPEPPVGAITVNQTTSIEISVDGARDGFVAYLQKRSVNGDWQDVSRLFSIGDRVLLPPSYLTEPGTYRLDTYVGNAERVSDTFVH